MNENENAKKHRIEREREGAEQARRPSAPQLAEREVDRPAAEDGQHDGRETKRDKGKPGEAGKQRAPGDLGKRIDRAEFEHLQPAGLQQMLDAPGVHPVVDHRNVRARSDQQPGHGEERGNRGQRRQVFRELRREGWTARRHDTVCGRVYARARRYNTAVPRFKVTIEYAGTRFSGWQIQKNARTVQGEIDRAVRTVTEPRRTSSCTARAAPMPGVHAAAQVAHLDVVTSLPAESLRRRVNDELPADINLLRIEPVPHRFHARHDAVGRRYLYQIARRRTAFAKPYVWWVKEPLDITRM